jgi:hypothetical protein
MRKALSIVGAALLVAATLATPAPASAQASTYGSLSASCGPSAGVYGDNNVTNEEANNAGSTVPALFYQINYAGVAPGSTLGILVRFNDELESQVGQTTFTTTGAAGTFAGRFGASIEPATQGGGTNFPKGGGAGGRNHGAGDLTGGSPRGGAEGARQQHSSGVQGGAALLPGDYHFYVYGGSIQDRGNGPQFVANESQFVGKFSCGADW